jgi:hypothetical protein
MSVHDTAVVVLAVAAFTAGWSASILHRHPTMQQRHDRAVAKFAQANRLRPTEPTADQVGTTVTLEGIRLRFVGAHPDGADVYVNAEPLPDAEAVHIAGMPDDTTVVIMESVR